MDMEKLDTILDELEDQIEKDTNRSEIIKRLLLGIAVGTGALGGFLFVSALSTPFLLIPSLFLGSLGTLVYAWQEYDSLQNELRIQKLKNEKEHVEGIKEGNIEISREKNEKKKREIEKEARKKRKNEQKANRYKMAFLTTVTLMFPTSFIIFANPYFALGTMFLFGGAHVFNKEIGKISGTIEKQNLEEECLEIDIDLLEEPEETQPENNTELSNTNENSNSQQNTRTATENNTSSENNSQDQIDETLNDIMSTPEFKALISSMAQHNPSEEELDIAVQAVVDIYSKRQENQAQRPKVNEIK